MTATKASSERAPDPWLAMPATRAFAAAAVVAALLAAAGVAGCQRPRSPAVPVATRGATTAVEVTSARARTASSAGGEVFVVRPEVLARARTTALATDRDAVFFGDDGKDTLSVVRKSGREVMPIGRPGAMDIALGDRFVFWIGAPGTSVLRAPRIGPFGTGQEVVRESGTFSAIAARGDDLYVAERAGEGGIVTRYGERGEDTIVARIAALPLALALDDTNVFVLTPSSLVRAPTAGGDVVALARGAAFSRLAADARAVYTTDVIGPSRALVRIDKGGGGPVVLEHAVRDAPIAVFRDDVFYFDGDHAILRRVRASGGASTIVAEREDFARATALVVDASGIFVAVVGAIVALPRPP